MFGLCIGYVYVYFQGYEVVLRMRNHLKNSFHFGFYTKITILI